MACAETIAKHNNFFSRLCCLLVDFGEQALRNVFDKIYPHERLHTVLSQHSVHATLESLLKRKILNYEQWGKLYPVIPSGVSSSNFDSTLLMVLLRSICDLKPPATGWNGCPSGADTSTEADIVRIIHYRNRFAHASHVSIDYNTLSMYWQKICVLLMRLGLESYKTDIENVWNSCMNPDMEDHYQRLLKQRTGKENHIKGKLQEMEMERKLSIKENQYEGPFRLEKCICGSNDTGTEDKASSSSMQFSLEQGKLDPAWFVEEIRQVYITSEECCSPFSTHQGKVVTSLNEISWKYPSGNGSEVVNMSAIFKPQEEPKRVLVCGSPGMGKSVLCQKLAYDWATEIQEADSCLPNFQLLLLLKCQFIRSNLWDAIDDQLLPCVTKEEEDQFFKFVRDNQSNILLVLDGLDELPSNNSSMISDLIQGRVLPYCHLLVTSRGASVGVRRYCDTLLEIVGFTERATRRFIATAVSNLPNNMRDKRLSELMRNKRLSELMKNPLNAALFCILSENNPSFCPESRTVLFKETLFFALKISTFNEYLTDSYKVEMKDLGKLALNALLEDKMCFKEGELGDSLSDIVQCRRSRNGSCYSFIHKSYQEFLAAFYLSRQILNEEMDPKVLIADKRYFHKMSQVLLFTTGLVAAENTEMAACFIKDVAAQVNQLNTDSPLRCGYYMNIALNCIEECSEKECNLRTKLAHVFGTQLTVEKVTLQVSVVVDSSLSDDDPDAFVGHFFVSSLSKALAVNISLTMLNVSNNIGDHGVILLSQALAVNSTLAILGLSGNDIGYVGVRSLAEALAVCTSLTRLDLSDNNICDSGTACLAQALSVNNTLKDLDLSRNKVSDGGAHFLAEALAVNSSLTRQYLSDNRICDSGTFFLAQALSANNTLKDLDLSKNGLSDIGARALAVALAANASLTRLDLSDNRICDSGTAFLVKALSTNNTLKDLDLSRNFISDIGARALAVALAANASLTRLELSVNKICDSGTACLAQALSVNTTFKDLDLSGNDMSDIGASSLAQALAANSSLTRLDLSDNKICDSGTACLAKALSVNNTLKDLGLSRNGITDIGVQSLTKALAVNSLLTRLDLSDNNIGDSGTAYLAHALSVNNTLTDLVLSGNGLGDFGVRSLAKALSINTSLTRLSFG